MQRSVRSYFISSSNPSVEPSKPVTAAAVDAALTAPGDTARAASNCEAPLAQEAMHGPAASLDAPAERSPWELHTKLVGRKHQASMAQPVPPDARLLLLRESDNPMDANAILVGGVVMSTT